MTASIFNDEIDVPVLNCKKRARRVVAVKSHGTPKVYYWFCSPLYNNNNNNNEL